MRRVPVSAGHACRASDATASVCLSQHRPRPRVHRGYGWQFRQAVLEELFVIRNFDVMDLQPHAGDVDGFAMRRETAVCVIDVIADVAGAADDVLIVLRSFREVALAVIVLVDLFERFTVLIDTAAAEFFFQNRIDRGRSCWRNWEGTWQRSGLRPCGAGRSGASAGWVVKRGRGTCQRKISISRHFGTACSKPSIGP